MGAMVGVTGVTDSGDQHRALSRRCLSLLLLTILSGQVALAQQASSGRGEGISGFEQVFVENCAVCHSENLQGAAQGTPLIGDLIHGDSIENLITGITDGYPEQGMPAWSQTFSDEEVKSLALFILEVRGGMLYNDFNIASELSLPVEPWQTEKYPLQLELVIDGLDPLPFSIAPMPDGSILLTEKMRGLSIISAAGVQSELITGTPQVFNDAPLGGGGLLFGQGWLLDVALHPRYEENGWIYLHYTERCSDCNEVSRQYDRPVSMNVLIRGRIKDGAWVDEQTIWSTDIENYQPATDLAAGGRIAFDPDGYVFISVGMRNLAGIQDLRQPTGKIHRIHDDGRVPSDNPFIDNPNASNTIWTYGHRSPQGLEFNVHSRELWGTEHGPRGGDEVNLLLPGRNYGWPLYSKGQNYNGTPVAAGQQLGIEFELKDIEQPIVDLTPSPAVSSFVFYEGDAFPAWRNNIVVGTLKATDLYRIEIVDNKPVHKEILIANLARIRDVEIGTTGELVLLLEHASGGKIVRIVPVPETLAEIR